MTRCFYVSSRYGQQSQLLLGPFEKHYQALLWVPWVKAEAWRQFTPDPNFPWYGWGTASLEHGPLDNPPPVGRFNEQRPEQLPSHVHPDSLRRLPNHAVAIGDEKRLRHDPTRAHNTSVNPVVARTWRVIGRPYGQPECLVLEPVGDDGQMGRWPANQRTLSIKFWNEHTPEGWTP